MIWSRTWTMSFSFALASSSLKLMTNSVPPCRSRPRRSLPAALSRTNLMTRLFEAVGRPGTLMTSLRRTRACVSSPREACSMLRYCASSGFSWRIASARASMSWYAFSAAAAASASALARRWDVSCALYASEALSLIASRAACAAAAAACVDSALASSFDAPAFARRSNVTRKSRSRRGNRAATQPPKTAMVSTQRQTSDRFMDSAFPRVLRIASEPDHAASPPRCRLAATGGTACQDAASRPSG